MYEMQWSEKTYWGMEVQLHSFLNSALDGGEWSASCPGVRVRGTHSVAGWVGSRTGLDAVAKREKGHLACSLVSMLTQIPRLQTKAYSSFSAPKLNALRT